MSLTYKSIHMKYAAPFFCIASTSILLHSLSFWLLAKWIRLDFEITILSEFHI